MKSPTIRRWSLIHTWSSLVCTLFLLLLAGPLLAAAWLDPRTFNGINIWIIDDLHGVAGKLGDAILLRSCKDRTDEPI